MICHPDNRTAHKQFRANNTANLPFYFQNWANEEHWEHLRIKYCTSPMNLCEESKVFFYIITAAVVLAFFLCWAPFHAQRLMYVYFRESKIFRTLNEYLYYISGFLYYLSATVNPILYNLMSLKYRHAFKQTLCGREVCNCVSI